MANFESFCRYLRPSYVPMVGQAELSDLNIILIQNYLKGITQEGLKNYRVSNRRCRNRRIGDFLKELQLTEGRNTGLKKFWIH